MLCCVLISRLSPRLSAAEADTEEKNIQRLELPKRLCSHPCLFVCLLVSEIPAHIWIKLGGGMGHGPERRINIMSLSSVRIQILIQVWRTCLGLFVQLGFLTFVHVSFRRSSNQEPTSLYHSVPCVAPGFCFPCELHAVTSCVCSAVIESWSLFWRAFCFCIQSAAILCWCSLVSALYYVAPRQQLSCLTAPSAPGHHQCTCLKGIHNTRVIVWLWGSLLLLGWIPSPLPQMRQSPPQPWGSS